MDQKESSPLRVKDLLQAARQVDVHSVQPLRSRDPSRSRSREPVLREEAKQGSGNDRMAGMVRDTLNHLLQGNSADPYQSLNHRRSSEERTGPSHKVSADAPQRAGGRNQTFASSTFGERLAGRSSPLRHKAGSIERDVLPTRDRPYNTHNVSRNYETQPHPTTNASAGLPPRNSTASSAGGQIRSDKLSTLMIDTSSLKNRLAIVTKEIDKVRQEQKVAHQQLISLCHQNEKYQDMLSKEDPLDFANRELKTDLDKERANNEMIKKQIEMENTSRKHTVEMVTEAQRKADQEMGKAQELTTSVSRLDQFWAQANHLNMQKKQEVNEFQSVLREATLAYEAVHREVEMLDEQLIGLQNQRADLLREMEIQGLNQEDQMKQLQYVQSEVHTSHCDTKKVIAAQMMLKSMESMVYNCHEDVMQNIVTYSRFDRDCKSKLKRLAILYKMKGELAMSKALDRWYANVLKPKAVYIQNELLADKFYNSSLMRTAFQLLAEELHEAKIDRNLQGNSILGILHILQRGQACEQRRAFTIWREWNGHNSRSSRFVLRILHAKRKSLLRQAIFTWRQTSQEAEQMVRQELLKRQFVQNLMLTSIVGNLRVSTSNQQAINYVKQGVFFKAWKGYLRKKQFQFRQLMLENRFCRLRFKTFMTKQCFDALKEHKQRNKQTLVNEALEETAVVSKELSTKLADRNLFLKRRYQADGAKTVRNMLSKQIFGYFDHWRLQSQHKRVFIRSKLRDQIIRNYIKFMKSYFMQWKTQRHKKARSDRRKMIVQMEVEQLTIQEETIQVERFQQDEEYRVKSQVKKKNSKLLKQFFLRQMALAWTRWTEVMEHHREKERKALFVIERMRGNYVRSGFDWYKHQIGMFHRFKKLNIRADNLLMVIQKKNMLKQFQAWCAYIQVNRKNAHRLGQILNDLFRFQVTRRFKTWHVESGKRKLVLLDSQVTDTAEAVKDLHQEMGEYQNITENHELKVEQMVDTARNKARKTLVNYYIRFYCQISEKAFRIWKHVFGVAKQRNILLLRMIQHYQKQVFYHVRAAFKFHITQQKQQERDEEIKIMEGQNKDLEQVIRFNEETAEKNEDMLIEKLQGKKKKEVRARTAVRRGVPKKTRKEEAEAQAKKKEEPKSEMELVEEKLDRAIELIGQRNVIRTFKSRKRKVYEQWKEVALKQKRAHLLFAKVMERSLYDVGFRHIYHTQKFNRNQARMYRLVSKYYIRIYEGRMREAINLWKQKNFKSITSHYGEVFQAHEEVCQGFSEKIVNVKDQNVANCELHFRRIKKFNLWKQWQETRIYADQQATLKSESVDLFASIKTKRALQKWFHRSRATMRYRNRMSQFEENYRFRMKRTIFDVFKFKQSVNNKMAKVMGNLENFMRTKILDDALKDIYSFALSKKVATSVFKRRATFDIYSFLNQRHEKVMRRNFHKYKFKVSDEKFRKMRLKIIFGKINAQRRHRGFRRWVHCVEKELLVEELNEVGPITEHVFEARRLMKNLQDFMRSEGYPEELIKVIVEDVNSGEMNKMRKVAMRWKLLGSSDGKLMMKAFDHLKMIIELRKIMRHWLIFSNNRVEYVKADMQEAFSRWRSGDIHRAMDLDQQPREYLVRKALKNSSELVKLAEKEGESLTVRKILTTQRDGLLEHFARAQKLALALCKDNHIKGKGTFFRLWAELRKGTKQEEALDEVKEAVEELTIVKEKQRDVERENKTLADENEELRQFSMDGFKIAQNANTLTAEREKLTIDLADQAEQIKKLMEENKRLHEALNNLKSGNKENVQATQNQGRRLDKSADRFKNASKLR